MKANQEKKELRVGVVTSTYARHPDDCQVPWMRELIRRISPAGAAVHVLAPSHRGLRGHDIDGVPVHRFRYAPARFETLTHDEGAPNKVRSLWFKLLVVPYIVMGAIAVFWWCLRHRIRILHVHWPFPHGLWAVLPKWLLGVKVVAMCHGAELAIARRSGVVRRVLGWLLRRADLCCANSSHTAAELRRVSGREAVITPYGATVEARGPGHRSTGGIPMLLFCGRLIQRKGIDVLLRAMVQILGEKEVRLVITGEGDRKAEWQALSAELGLENSVRFAGFVSDGELAILYATCDVYVHPAIFDDNGDTEGLGVVLIEALAHRKPVVASAVGGIVDVIVDGETGLLVPEKDEAALAQAILRVLEDQDLAFEMGCKGFARVKRFFDWERITDQTVNLFASLVAPASKAEPGSGMTVPVVTERGPRNGQPVGGMTGSFPRPARQIPALCAARIDHDRDGRATFKAPRPDPISSLPRS
ncbi:MAG: glycosyltransferase family 4 protein [Akkermansiaceae bacterium]|nr:glycosyltransferase family 4 protein [Akkermansiaceae bacterium]NNM29801.1 glycosyltransferase family 4 protein [Akkermansiaceae bacterium]